MGQRERSAAGSAGAEDASAGGRPGAADGSIVRPVPGGWRPQRQTADRNRAAILAAAAARVATDGVERVDMREIARAAGVGIGTLYRRFGDKTGLLAALIGDREQELQEGLLRGAPPLGPGAPAAERLEAFLDALSDLTERNLDVLLASQSSAPGARLRLGAHQAWRLHLVVLLAELRPDLDAGGRGWLAEVLLAPLSADLYAAQRVDNGRTAPQLRAYLHDLAERLTTPP